MDANSNLKDLLIIFKTRFESNNFRSSIELFEEVFNFLNNQEGPKKLRLIDDIVNIKGSSILNQTPIKSNLLDLMNIDPKVSSESDKYSNALYWLFSYLRKEIIRKKLDKSDPYLGVSDIPMEYFKNVGYNDNSIVRQKTLTDFQF